MSDHLMTVHDTSLNALSVLDTCTKVAYTLKLNDLSTGTIVLASEDPANAYCEPMRFLRLWDGDRDMGWWRISGMADGNSMPGGTNTYSIEHASCTLLDDVLSLSMTTVQSWKNTTIGAVLTSLLNLQQTARWQLGVDDLATYAVSEYSPDNVTLYKAITDVCAMAGTDYVLDWDTSTTPWTLNVRSAPTATGCWIHYGRNLVTVKKKVDCSTLVTRLYPQGKTIGGKILDVSSVNNGQPYMEASTVDAYGVHSACWVDETIGKAGELFTAAGRILAQYSVPYITYEVQAVDLSELSGYSWDQFVPGKMVRVLDDEHGIDFNARVQTVAKNDINGAPWDVTVTLANKTRDAVSTLNKLKEKVSRGARNASNRESSTTEELAKYWTEITNNSKEIALCAKSEVVSTLTGRVTSCESEISTMASGITLSNEKITTLEGEMTTAKAQLLLHDGSIGTLVTTTEALDGRVTSAESSIEQYADNIKLYVKTADLNSSIELSGAGVTISGGTITLDGQTVAEQLYGQDITGGNITSTDMSATNGDFDNLTGGAAGFSTLSVDSTACAAHTLTIGGSSCTFFAPADASFELSDLPGYAEAMQAARTAGAQAVSISSDDITLSSTGYYPSTNKMLMYVNVRAEADNGKSATQGLEVDVTAVYEQGKTDGGGKTYTASSLTVDGQAYTGTDPITYTTYSRSAMTKNTVGAGCELGVRSPSGTFTRWINNSGTSNMYISYTSQTTDTTQYRAYNAKNHTITYTASSYV